MSVQHFLGHAAIQSASSIVDPWLRGGTQWANTKTANELPSAELIMDAARRGFIQLSDAEQWLKWHGILLNADGTNPSTGTIGWFDNMSALWNRVYWAAQELPTLEQVLTLTNRGILQENTLPINLKRLGFMSTEVQAAVTNLRFEIPSSSDLVRFSVRHVFEPDLIAHFGYNDEFRPILDMWHKFQGLNYPIFTGPFEEQVAAFERSRGLPEGAFIRSYAAVGLPDPTWAQAFWWSHWVLPSPSQGYEMLFRLRPDRNRQFDPPEAEGLEFRYRDLELLLRANDYPPFYRPALAAISYRVPGIRFLRQLVHTGVFNAGDVYELLRRQGYSDGDANILTETVIRNEAEQQRKGAEAKAKGKLASYWELGIIDDAQYVADLTAAGMDPSEAQETLNLARVDYQYKRVKGIVSYVRKQFTSGRINLGAAREALQGVGIVGSRIEDYLHDWGLQLARQGKEATAAKIVKWACDGFISIDDLATRLGNLGYDASDVDAFVKEATLCQQGRVAKAAAQAAKTLAQQQKAQQAAVKAQTAQLRAARKALSSHGTPAQLRKWFCEGLIGQVEVYERLNFLGWPDADISRLIGDCKAGTGTGRGGPRSPVSGGAGTVGGSPGAAGG